MSAMPDPSHMVLKIESRTHSANDPGAFFEWHQVAGKVYAVRTEPGKAIKQGFLIGAANTSEQAKHVVAAYAQGFAHGKGLA